MLKRRFQILFLAAVILTVYYPAIFAELNSVDDVGMVTAILNTEHWSLSDLFFPKGGIGLYFRPFLVLSFLIDKELWFMETSFLHLVNMLLHLFNAILVYILALKLLPDSERKISFLPLIAALCFGLHPIATESVNWVSGRTDLLACSFLLLCAISLVLFNRERRFRYLFSAAIALLCAVLTKEVSLAFLLGAFFLLNAESSADVTTAMSLGGRFKRMAPKLLLLCIIAGGLVLVCFYLRSHPYRFNSSKLRMTFRFISDDPFHAIFVFLRAFGFYLKKIYWPFPLNYAIMEVDPLYELLAMPIVLGCGYLAVRRDLMSATFLAGVCMITPAFIPAFNQVAWTPYAERYVYIASAFVITSSVLFLGKQALKHNLGVGVKVGVPCLLAIMGVTTFQRSLVWQHNLSLYKDTVAKSPDFSKTWNELGVAYYNKKDLQNAELSFAKAGALYSLYYDEESDMNLVNVLLDEGKENEAAEVYKRVLKRGGDKSAKILEHYISFLSSRKSADKGENQREIMKYLEKLYALNGSPLVLYQMAEISANLGDRQKACEYFRKAGEEFKQGDIYKEKAKRQLKRLEEE